MTTNKMNNTWMSKNSINNSKNSKTHKINWKDKY